MYIIIKTMNYIEFHTQKKYKYRSVFMLFQIPTSNSILQ